MKEIDYLNHFFKRSMRFGAPKVNCKTPSFKPKKPDEKYTRLKVRHDFGIHGFYDGFVRFSDYVNGRDGQPEIQYNVCFYKDGKTNDYVETTIIKDIKNFNETYPAQASSNQLPQSGSTGKAVVQKPSGRQQPYPTPGAGPSSSAGPSSGAGPSSTRAIVQKYANGTPVLMDHPEFGIKLFGKLENILTLAQTPSNKYKVIWEDTRYPSTSDFNINDIRTGITNFQNYTNNQNNLLPPFSALTLPFNPSFSSIGGHRFLDIDLYNIASENFGHAPSVHEQMLWVIIFRFFIVLDTVHDIYDQIKLSVPGGAEKRKNLMLQLYKSYHSDIIDLVNTIGPHLTPPPPKQFVFSYDVTDPDMKDYAAWVLDTFFPEHLGIKDPAEPDTVLDVMFADIKDQNKKYINLMDLGANASVNDEHTGENASGLYLPAGLKKLGIDPTGFIWLKEQSVLRALYWNQNKTRPPAKPDVAVSADISAPGAEITNISQVTSEFPQYISKADYYDASGIGTELTNGEFNEKFVENLANHTFNIFFGFRIPGISPPERMGFANITYTMETDNGLIPLIINSFIGKNTTDIFKIDVPINSRMISNDIEKVGSEKGIVASRLISDQLLSSGNNDLNYLKTQIIVLFKFFGDFGKGLYAYLYQQFGVSLFVSKDGLSAGITSLFVPGTVTSNIRFGNIAKFKANPKRRPTVEFFFRRTYIPQIELRRDAPNIYTFNEDLSVQTELDYKQTFLRALCKHDKNGIDCDLSFDMPDYEGRWGPCLDTYLALCIRDGIYPTIDGFVVFRTSSEYANTRCAPPTQEQTMTDLFYAARAIAARRGSDMFRRVSGIFSPPFKQKQDFGKKKMNSEERYLASLLRK